MSLLRLFCDVDDFCQIYEAEYERHLLAEGSVKRTRSPQQLSASEMMTIVIHFHQSS